MNFEHTYPRKVDIAMSRGQVNDAFTSLLLMTGYLNEGEKITNVTLPLVWAGEVDLVKFKVEKEVPRVADQAA